MKRFIKLLFIALVVITSSSCTYLHYFLNYDEYSDDFYSVQRGMITQVSYTMLGTYTDFETDSKLILETDSYNRTLFIMRCWNKIEFDDEKNLIYMGIIQRVDQGFVYYYPGEQYYLLTEDVNLLMEDEMFKFKETNNWNEPLLLDRCVKKELVYYSPSGSFKRRELLRIIDDSINIDYTEYFSYYLDTDINGLELYALYFECLDENNETKHLIYAIIIDSKNRTYFSLKKISLSDFRSELLEFKIENEWTYDYCKEV